MLASAVSQQLANLSFHEYPKSLQATRPHDVDPGLYALLITILTPEQAALLLRNELPGLRSAEHAAVAAARTQAEADKEAKIAAAREKAVAGVAAARNGVAMLEAVVASAETDAASPAAGLEAVAKVAFLQTVLTSTRTAADAQIAAVHLEVEAQVAAAIGEAEARVAAAVERCRSESRRYLLAKARSQASEQGTDSEHPTES